MNLLSIGINRLRFASAEDLLDRGAELVDETGTPPAERGSSSAGGASHARSAHFESAIALRRHGRGVQASMLNRVLLEEALEVHWIAANPDLAPQFADQHEEPQSLGEQALEFQSGRSPDPLTDEEQERLSELRKICGGFDSSWTRECYAGRLKLIEKRWGDEAARELDYVYDVIQRQNNILLHVTQRLRLGHVTRPPLDQPCRCGFALARRAWPWRPRLLHDQAGGRRGVRVRQGACGGSVLRYIVPASRDLPGGASEPAP